MISSIIPIDRMVDWLRLLNLATTMFYIKLRHVPMLLCPLPVALHITDTPSTVQDFPGSTGIII